MPLWRGGWTAHGGHALVQYTRTGSDLWLGQDTSIEGGLLAGGAIVLAAVVAHLLAARRGMRLSDTIDPAADPAIDLAGGGAVGPASRHRPA